MSPHLYDSNGFPLVSSSLSDPNESPVVFLSLMNLISLHYSLWFSWIPIGLIILQ